MEKDILTENRLSTMEQKIDNIITSVDKIEKKIDKHVEWEAEKYEKLDSKYSGKWVEKAIISIGTAVVISIIIAILKFI